ncbi:MAG: Ppx/GppA family phosphatase [Deltaproteobacteria bacterium]|nr:Ppx/GppA family phosphatase [Deltaproteobacteria bacterium]
MLLVEPVHIAAIDTGSNAIRVAVCAAVSPSEINPLVSERVPVRLGHGTFVRGEIDAATFDNAITAFARFRKLFDQYGVTHYRAVATSAVRNARNRDQLLHRLFHDTQIELDVIDGEEEARLVRRAVLSVFKKKEKPTTIVDLGGGSLEITNRTDKDWHTASMRIGTVRLMETFGLTGSISPDEAKMMRRYVASLLHQAVPLDEIDPSALTAACGGNAEELANLFGTRLENGRLTISRQQLEDALPKVLKYDVEKRMSKFGVRQDRAEVMGVAALVFAAVMTELRIDALQIPEVGIREGILLELAESHAQDDLPSGKARRMALLASARVFATRMRHDTTHGEQVRVLARALFDQLKELHGLPGKLGTVLEVAAILHDIGEVVHRKGHHRHGEYLVMNGRIPGLESPQREMVAALVRAHRKSLPYPKKHLTYSTLSDKHQAQVRRLAALLRIADAIDTDHRQRVGDLQVEMGDDEVILHVTLEDDAVDTAHLARRKSQAFEQELGLPVSIDVKVVPAQRHAPIARTE